MLILLIVSIMLGGIVSAVTGLGFLFWVIAIVIFICGLPFTLISSFIDDKIDRAQDRADYREFMRQYREDERELMRYLHEYEKDEDRYNIFVDNRKYYDNRQVHYNEDKKDKDHFKLIKS